MLQQIVQGILTAEFRIVNHRDDEVEIDTDPSKRVTD